MKQELVINPAQELIILTLQRIVVYKIAQPSPTYMLLIINVFLLALMANLKITQLARVSLNVLIYLLHMGMIVLINVSLIVLLLLIILLIIKQEDV